MLVKQMSTRDYVLWITRTALFLAILISLQALSRQFGNQILTGSIVNLMLVLTVMTCGPISGIFVAGTSPVVAAMLGIAPNWFVVPVIVIANIVFVIAWHFIGNTNLKNKFISYGIACAVGALAKFVVLYLGVVYIVIPVFMNLPPEAPQVAVMTTTFGVIQILTAAIGGVVAILIIPTLKKIIRLQKR